MLRRSQASQRGPMETEEFARRLADALQRSRAPKLLRIGRGARFLSALQWLPRGVRDAMFARAFGLSDLDSGGAD
jgi:hypothetical protein